MLQQHDQKYSKIPWLNTCSLCYTHLSTTSTYLRLKGKVSLLHVVYVYVLTSQYLHFS